MRVIDKNLIFHIADRVEWEKGRQKGTYTAASLETEGFIHCLTREQVVAKADSLFKSQKNLLLLYIDPKEVPELKFEKQKNGLYPHVYGPINTDAVVRVVTLNPQEDGSFLLPPDLL